MNSSSANLRLSKTQLSKMVQFGRFLLPDILPFKLVNSVTNSLLNSFGEELKKWRLFLKKMNKKDGQEFLINVAFNILRKNINKGISKITSS